MDIGSLWIAILAVGVGMILLCVGVIFRKDHSFRSQHIGENERMRKNGIRCATSQDREERKRSVKSLNC